MSPSMHFVRLFLALGWARAVVAKLIDTDWWTGAYLDHFLTDQRDLMLPFLRVLPDHLSGPGTVAVSAAVLVIQVAIAACLGTNRFVTPALWAGVVLNVSFIMVGQVNPSVFYLVLEIALLFSLAPAVQLGPESPRVWVWGVVAVALLPFARTLSPEHVIDDPALVLAMLAILTGFTSLLLAGSQPADVAREIRARRASAGSPAWPPPRLRPQPMEDST